MADVARKWWKPPADVVGLVLVALILVSFTLGAYRINKQADDIHALVEAQKELTFVFHSTTGTATITVKCLKVDDRYTCVSKESP